MPPEHRSLLSPNFPCGRLDGLLVPAELAHLAERLLRLLVDRARALVERHRCLRVGVRLRLSLALWGRRRPLDLVDRLTLRCIELVPVVGGLPGLRELLAKLGRGVGFRRLRLR